MAMIRDAFHDTDFSVPTVNIQPEGDVTLVNLPTYFEVQFPRSGFGPDEVDTPDPARLLGYSHRGATAAEVDHLPPRHHDDRADDVLGWAAPDR